MASSLSRSAQRLVLVSAANSSSSSSAAAAASLALASSSSSHRPRADAVLHLRCSRCFFASGAGAAGTTAAGTSNSAATPSSSSSSSAHPSIRVSEAVSEYLTRFDSGQGTAASNQEVLKQLGAFLSELQWQDVSPEDLAMTSAMLEVFSHQPIAQSLPAEVQKHTSNVAQVLADRLAGADAKALAAVARSFAKLRARDELVLSKVAARASELGAATTASGPSSTSSSSSDVKSNASLLDSFGKLASRGDGGRRFGRRAEAPGAHHSKRNPPQWIEKAATLQKPLARMAQEMRAMDIALALAGLARLGGSEIEFFEAVHLRLRYLAEAARQQPDSSDIVEPRVSAMLLSSLAAQARLGRRHEGCLQEVASMLATAASHGKPVPQGFLLPMLRALSLNLQPVPNALLPALEVSIAQNASHFSARELSLLLKYVAMLPGLRATRHSLGRQLFTACLAAPLSGLTSEGLANCLRAAWSLGHADASFWGVCLRTCHDRILEETLQAADRPSLDDLMNMALVAGRLLEKATASAGRGHSSSEAPAVAAALAASGKAPAYLTGAPAAAKLLEAACLEALTGRHEGALTSRHLATFASALARAGQDNGALFGMISHKAGSLLEGHAAFNARDVAQLLAALARFQYQDETLLAVLVQRAEADFESYDGKARDSVLWSLSELGIEPVSRGILSDALLEYDLKRGVATDSTESHLASIEVHPSLDDVHDGFAEAQPYGSYYGSRYESSGQQDWKLQPDRPPRGDLRQ